MSLLISPPPPPPLLFDPFMITTLIVNHSDATFPLHFNDPPKSVSVSEFTLYHLPDDKISALSLSEEFADDKLNVALKMHPL